MFMLKDNYEGGYGNLKEKVTEFKGSSKPNGNLRKAKKGSLEEFLFERYCLYVTYKNKTHIAYTCHEKWEFQENWK